MPLPPITRFSALATNPSPTNNNNGLYVPRLNTAKIAAIPTATKVNGGMWYNDDANRLEARVNDTTIILAAGNGNVSGPNGATDNSLAAFDGTTGKIIKDSGMVVGVIPVPSSFQLFSNPGKVSNATLEYIKFTNDIAGIFVDSLMPVEFITNNIGEDHVCSLFTGGIPSSSTSPSALIELQSDIGALLLSRMTTVERDVLSTPVDANGMLLFNTTSGQFNGFDGANWRTIPLIIDTGINLFIGKLAGNLTTTGISNTGVGTNSLESLTNGNANSAFGYQSLLLNTTGIGNAAFGYQSLSNNTIGGGNAAFGYQSLSNNTIGTNNAAFGSESLLNNTASNNSAFGNESLFSNTTGADNAAFGYRSLLSNTTGSNNSAFGYRSLQLNVIGNSNVAFGDKALQNNIADNNSAFGYQSLQNNTVSNNSAFGALSLQLNTTGSGNAAFGYQSLQANTTGGFNAAFGYQSLLLNTTGSYNSAFGTLSLANNTTGSPNSAFGYQCLTSNTTGNYNSAFGIQSLLSNTTGNYNSAFGIQSLLSNTTGSPNSAFGYQCLSTNTTGNNNSAFGYQSLQLNVIGNSNVAFGDQSLQNNTVSNNSAFGYQSLKTNTIGTNNSAFGFESLSNNTIGNNNSTFGYQSLQLNTTGSTNSAFGTLSLLSNTTGSNNAAFGGGSLLSNTTGSFNSAFGTESLSNNTTGSFNSAFGNDAGATQAIYNNCTFFGYEADSSVNNLTNAIAIGYQASVGASNCMVLGGSSTNQLSVGIGITPHAQLQLPTIHANRKIVLYETINNDHQVFGLGTATGIFNSQIDATGSAFTWKAATSSSASNELMRLTGGGLLYAKQSFACYSGYTVGGTNTVMSASTSTYTKLAWTSTTLQSILSNYTSSSNSFIYNGGSIFPPGLQEIKVSLCLTQNGAAGEVTTFAIFKNGVQISGARATLCVTGGSSTSFPVVLTTGAVITTSSDFFDVRAVHSVGSRTLNVTELNFSISST
jgi:hypothetical protein